MTDFHAVRHEHTAIHERLLNWARWSRTHRGGYATLPMFRLYRPDNYERTPGEAAPDSLDAVALQKLFAHVPEKNRWALQWAYCYPFISPQKACRALVVTRAGLCELVHDGRSMVKNRAGEEKQPRVLTKGLV